ncbi:MAG: hypothetical protein M5U14_11840 [Acidimicrobiia bacterium]|nr:hypothetical protein [Acidimicrobiia bacterium]
MTEIVSAIRRFRSEHRLRPSARIEAFVRPADARQRAALDALATEVTVLAGLERLELVDRREPRGGEQRLVAAGAEIAVPLAGLVDVDAARRQLDKQTAKLEADLARVSAKLDDPSFTAKAPPDVVEKQRVRRGELRDALEALHAQRELLGES